MVSYAESLEEIHEFSHHGWLDDEHNLNLVLPECADHIEQQPLVTGARFVDLTWNEKIAN